VRVAGCGTERWNTKHSGLRRGSDVEVVGFNHGVDSKCRARLALTEGAVAAMCYQRWGGERVGYTFAGTVAFKGCEGRVGFRRHCGRSCRDYLVGTMCSHRREASEE
jgi:hypothetical protein